MADIGYGLANDARRPAISFRLFDRKEAVALLAWPSSPLTRPDLEDLTNEDMLAALRWRSCVPASEISGVIDRALAFT